MNRDGRRSEERTRSGERRPAGERRSGSGREPDGSGAPGDGEGRPGHSPPIRAVAILGRLIPWLEREAVLADLAELYRIKVERHGPVAARRWYWRQVAAFAFRRPFRGADGSGWGAVFGDLKYAARTLLRSPTFTITAIVTLALGIGANTAVFSVVNSVLLREIPYPDADRLLWVYTDAPPNRWPFSVADLQFLEERNRTFESVAGWSPRRMTFAASGVAERILANRVTASFFGTLGVAPALGRDFTPADAAPGAEPDGDRQPGFLEHSARGRPGRARPNGPPRRNELHGRRSDASRGGSARGSTIRAVAADAAHAAGTERAVLPSDRRANADGGDTLRDLGGAPAPQRRDVPTVGGYLFGPDRVLERDHGDGVGRR